MALVRYIENLFSRWRSGSSPPAENIHHALGRQGEKVAARFLRKQRYKVLYRNFRSRRGGEVDIVCRDGESLVFVEVKTRSSELFGRPAEAVNRDKQELIARGALAWLRMLDRRDVIFRFDIVEVVKEDGILIPTLIKDAFQLPSRYIL
jgi:putative endonuclease